MDEQGQPIEPDPVPDAILPSDDSASNAATKQSIPEAPTSGALDSDTAAAEFSSGKTISLDPVIEPLSVPAPESSERKPESTDHDPDASSQKKPVDPIVAKRLEHGLSPQPTDSQDLPNTGQTELDRLEKRTFNKERREQKEAADRLRKLQRKHRIQTVTRVMVVVLILLIAAIIVGFWFVRWMSIDDKSAIQGTWKMEGSEATMTITEDRIVLTDDVAYNYVIDPDAKTIYYTFGNLEGSGRYRFSLDGEHLAVQDGEYDWFKTLVGDIPWTIRAVTAQLAGKETVSPALDAEGKVFERVE